MLVGGPGRHGQRDEEGVERDGEEVFEEGVGGELGGEEGDALVVTEGLAGVEEETNLPGAEEEGLEEEQADDLGDSDDEGLIISTLAPLTFVPPALPSPPIPSLAPPQVPYFTISSCPSSPRLLPAAPDPTPPPVTPASSSPIHTKSQEELSSTWVERDERVKESANTALEPDSLAEPAEERIAMERMQEGRGRKRRKLNVQKFDEWVVKRGKGEERLFEKEFGRAMGEEGSEL